MSTRGNAEAILAALVLAVLFFVKKGNAMRFGNNVCNCLDVSGYLIVLRCGKAHPSFFPEQDATIWPLSFMGVRFT